ncbi:hypothetical protein DFJ73DRAFT_960882 [Zopfochytrium polystomum]|nr:hypothetical protein DFJ73DRAFT_960882 [Zopfochytrium polystomum]
MHCRSDYSAAEKPSTRPLSTKAAAAAAIEPRVPTNTCNAVERTTVCPDAAANGSEAMESDKRAGGPAWAPIMPPSEAEHSPSGGGGGGAQPASSSSCSAPLSPTGVALPSPNPSPDLAAVAPPCSPGPAVSAPQQQRSSLSPSPSHPPQPQPPESPAADPSTECATAPSGFDGSLPSSLSLFTGDQTGPSSLVPASASGRHMSSTLCTEVAPNIGASPAAPRADGSSSLEAGKSAEPSSPHPSSNLASLPVNTPAPQPSQVYAPGTAQVPMTPPPTVFNLVVPTVMYSSPQAPFSGFGSATPSSQALFHMQLQRIQQQQQQLYQEQQNLLLQHQYQCQVQYQQQNQSTPCGGQCTTTAAGVLEKRESSPVPTSPCSCCDGSAEDGCGAEISCNVEGCEACHCPECEAEAAAADSLRTTAPAQQMNGTYAATVAASPTTSSGTSLDSHFPTLTSGSPQSKPEALPMFVPIASGVGAAGAVGAQPTNSSVPPFFIPMPLQQHQLQQLGVDAAQPQELSQHSGQSSAMTAMTSGSAPVGPHSSDTPQAGRGMSVVSVGLPVQPLTMQMAMPMTLTPMPTSNTAVFGGGSGGYSETTRSTPPATPPGNSNLPHPHPQGCSYPYQPQQPQPAQPHVYHSVHGHHYQYQNEAMIRGAAFPLHGQYGPPGVGGIDGGGVGGVYPTSSSSSSSSSMESPPPSSSSSPRVRNYPCTQCDKTFFAEPGPDTARRHAHGPVGAAASMSERLRAAVWKGRRGVPALEDELQAGEGGGQGRRRRRSGREARSDRRGRRQCAMVWGWRYGFSHAKGEAATTESLRGTPFESNRIFLLDRLDSKQQRTF